MNLIGKLQPVIIICAALIGLIFGAVTPFGSAAGSLIEPFLILLLYILFLCVDLRKLGTSLLVSMFIPLLLFFTILFFVSQIVGRMEGFSRQDIVALNFTTLARNSPLSLAIAVATFPNRPLISLALVIGPLIELPILSLIAGILGKWNADSKL